MCRLSNDDFYDDMMFDAEYQDWLRTKKQQEIDRWYAEYFAEQEAYTKMAEEHFKDVEEMEKYEKIS